MKRREFLNAGLLTAATVALAGCGRAPDQALVSQAMLPEFYLPGIAKWFATTCGECANSCGVGVRVIGGRAKKVEGLSHHPLSHGGHCLRADSALQALYNPDRLLAPHRLDGDIQRQATWNDALPALGGALKAAADNPGSGLFITGPLRGTRGAMVAEMARRTGSKIWVHDFPGTRVERLGLAALGDAPRLPWLHLAAADYVVNFGSDFLGTGPSPVDAGRQYGSFRHGNGRQRRGIMVSFTSRMSMTAANSDRWVPTRPGTEGWVAAAVGTLLASHGKGTMPPWASVDPKQASLVSGVPEELIHRLATKLQGARAGLAVGGYDNAAHEDGLWTVATIQALNRMLGTANRETWEPDMLVAPAGLTVTAPAALQVSSRQAVEGLQKGTFKTVLLLDCNPAFVMPTRLDLAGLLARASTFAFSPFRTESTDVARWVLPIGTWLEEWGDTRVDGPVATYGIRQPAALLPETLRGGLPLADLLELVVAQNVGGDLAKGFPAPPTVMKDLIQARFAPGTWTTALERGGLWEDDDQALWPYPRAPLYPPATRRIGGASLPAGTSAWQGLATAAPTMPQAPAPLPAGQYVLVPYPSPLWHDGSVVNRPWIPEVPDPMAQAVWDTWVEINPQVARAMGIERGDLVRLTSEAGVLEVPALVLPTIHAEAVAMPVGLGHTSLGRYARGKGSNPMALVNPAWQAGTDEPVYASTRVTVARTGKKGRVITYDHRAGDLERGFGEGSGIGGEK